MNSLTDRFDTYVNHLGMPEGSAAEFIKALAANADQVHQADLHRGAACPHRKVELPGDDPDAGSFTEDRTQRPPQTQGRE